MVEVKCLIEITAVRIGEVIDRGLFENVFSCLPEDKQNKIKRFRKYEDSKRALIAEVLIRCIIIEKLGMKNKDIFFKTGEHGKPYLSGVDGFHYNLSHSGDWVVCAVGEKPVGIDVEKIKQMDFDIARRFFSKQETDSIYSKDESERLGYFFELWTLKESYIKADGGGLSIPLSSFSFEINNTGIRLKTQNKLSNCFFKQYFISKDYRLAVCSLEGKFPESITIKETKGIFEFFEDYM